MKKIIKLAIILAVIGGLSAFCLSLVNDVTKPLIDERATAKARIYLEAIFTDSDTFEVANENGNGSAIESVYIAKSGSTIDGYAYMLNVKGYSGTPISYIIGISTDGKFVGYEVLDASGETPGIGTRVQEEEFSKQFDDTSINKGIDTLSGATISSKAVISGINEAIEDFNKNYK